MKKLGSAFFLLWAASCLAQTWQPETVTLYRHPIPASEPLVPNFDLLGWFHPFPGIFDYNNYFFTRAVGRGYRAEDDNQTFTFPEGWVCTYRQNTLSCVYVGGNIEGNK